MAQCTVLVSAKCLAATKKSPVRTLTAARMHRSIDNQDGCHSLGEQEVGGWGWGLTVQETTAGWQSQMSKQRLHDSAIYYGISRHCCYCCRQRNEDGGRVCVCVWLCVAVCVCVRLFKNKVEKREEKRKAKRITSARSRLWNQLSSVPRCDKCLKHSVQCVHTHMKV